MATWRVFESLYGRAYAHAVVRRVILLMVLSFLAGVALGAWVL